MNKLRKVPAFPKVDDSPQVDDSALQNNGLVKDDFSDDVEENEENMVLRSGKRVKFADYKDYDVFKSDNEQEEREQALLDQLHQLTSDTKPDVKPEFKPPLASEYILYSKRNRWLCCTVLLLILRIL